MFPGQNKGEEFAERVLQSFNIWDLWWFLIIHTKEHLARVDSPTFHYSSNHFEKPLLCSAGSNPQELPQDLGPQSKRIGVNLHSCLHPSRAREIWATWRNFNSSLSEINIFSRDSCEDAFSQQPSGELGISLSLELTHTVEFHITVGNTLREFELEAAL